MARASAVEETTSKSVTETITYVPGHGDPSITQWGGLTFHANVPKELTGHPEGTAREKLNHELIERARENKHFTVGGAKRARAKAVTPETPEQYRAHLVEWIKEVGPDGQSVIRSVQQLIKRFADERDLRAICEVGASDYDLIGSIFMPKLGELAKADELTVEQVATIWKTNGFNELPW